MIQMIVCLVERLSSPKDFKVIERLQFKTNKTNPNTLCSFSM